MLQDVCFFMLYSINFCYLHFILFSIVVFCQAPQSRLPWLVGKVPGELSESASSRCCPEAAWRRLETIHIDSLPIFRQEHQVIIRNHRWLGTWDDFHVLRFLATSVWSALCSCSGAKFCDAAATSWLLHKMKLTFIYILDCSWLFCTDGTPFLLEKDVKEVLGLLVIF